MQVLVWSKVKYNNTEKIYSVYFYTYFYIYINIWLLLLPCEAQTTMILGFEASLDKTLTPSIWVKLPSKLCSERINNNNNKKRWLKQYWK